MLRLIGISICLTALRLFSGESAVGDLPRPVLCGTLPKVIDESSGLIKSKKYPDKDIFWTHNDSGDSARIFAIDSTGKLIREVAIPNARNVDWEEITMDEQGRIVVCDIGDNNRDNNRGKRIGVVFYRFAEPDALNKNEAPPVAQAFRFHYPKGEGPFDAEGVFIRAGSAYLFTKQIEGANCYRLPLPEKAPFENVEMTRVIKLAPFNVVTAASITEDGRHIALLNYVSLAVIDLPEPFENLKENAAHELPIFDAPRRSVLTFLGQTEGVAWDGRDLVVTVEGADIFRAKDVLKQ